MDKEIKKVENCLKSMKKCLKIPNVENCVCFSDAFKVLSSEVDELYKKSSQLQGIGTREKINSLKQEIEEIQKIVSKGEKKCLDCSPCMASVVFKTHPDKLNYLYLDNQL